MKSVLLIHFTFDPLQSMYFMGQWSFHHHTENTNAKNVLDNGRVVYIYRLLYTWSIWSVQTDIVFVKPTSKPNKTFTKRKIENLIKMKMLEQNKYNGFPLESYSIEPSIMIMMSFQCLAHCFIEKPYYLVGGTRLRSGHQTDMP